VYPEVDRVLAVDLSSLPYPESLQPLLDCTFIMIINDKFYEIFITWTAYLLAKTLDAGIKPWTV
jgi:hypothetical protein